MSAGTKSKTSEIIPELALIINRSQTDELKSSKSRTGWPGIQMLTVRVNRRFSVYFQCYSKSTPN